MEDEKKMGLWNFIYKDDDSKGFEGNVGNEIVFWGFFIRLIPSLNLSSERFGSRERG